MEPYETATSSLEVMVRSCFKKHTWVTFILLIHSLLGLSQTSTDVVSDGEHTIRVTDRYPDTPAIVRKCVLKAQGDAIEKAFGKVIYQKTLMNISNKNENNNIKSSETFEMESESNLSGRWLKDASPPLVESFQRNGELWIRVRVKGYVREIEPKRFNEDREALAIYIKELHGRNPFSDITVVETYDSRFLVSVISLDPSRYSTTSEMYRVASIKAKSLVSRYLNGSQSEEIFVVQAYVARQGDKSSPDLSNTISVIRETSQGWVNGIEYLTSFPGLDGKDRVFVYLKFLNKLT